MRQEDMQRVLDTAPVITTPRDNRESEDLQAFLEHPGFPIFYGLLLAARQAQYAALHNAGLGTAEKDTHAARIQGTITGIEMVAMTALEMAIPSQDTSEGAKA